LLHSHECNKKIYIEYFPVAITECSVQTPPVAKQPLELGWDQIPFSVFHQGTHILQHNLQVRFFVGILYGFDFLLHRHFQTLQRRQIYHSFVGHAALFG